MLFLKIFQHLVTFPTFDANLIPLLAIQLIYDPSDLICFHDWSIFSSVLREKSTTSLDLLRFRQQIEDPKSALPIYVQPIVSNQFAHITFLCIATSFAIPDLVRLSAVTNLGALEIIKPSDEDIPESCRVGDRLIRAWHEAASEGAFSVLRILRLWGHEDVTYQSLNYINSFRSLAIYDVRGCGFSIASRHLASELGWGTCLHKELLEVLEEACKEKYASIQTPPPAGTEPRLVFDRNQLYDTAKVRLIPRESAPALSVSHQALDCEIPEPRSGSPSWDFETTTSFSRIGLLRNDLDFIRAGVPITSHALVEQELINSVPMASICLGSIPKRYHYSNWANLHLFFVRTKTLTPDPVHLAVKDEGRTKNHTARTALRSVPLPDRNTSMRRSKRQKLEDMLGSFQ